MKKHINLNGLMFEVTPAGQGLGRRKFHGQLCSYEQIDEQSIKHQLRMRAIENQIVRTRYKQ